MMRIVIVGAGVAGSILARRLERISGIELTCLERVSREDHSHAGTGLNIGPNAVKALTRTDPDLARAVAVASLPWKSWRLSMADGRELFNLPLDRVADCDGWRIRWSELYRVLRGASASIRYECTIDDLGPDPQDSARSAVAWTDAEGRHRLENIDLLIAGDGRYSRTRETFLGPPTSRHLGVAIFRLLVPDTSGGLIDDYEQWFNGPHRLLAFRVPPAHIYIAGSLPVAPGSELADDRKTPQALREAYTPAATKPGDQVAWMIEQICANTSDIHWARMQEAELAFRAPDANVLFIGDAAHAMVPTMGQGATQAIEDACVIGALIAEGVASEISVDAMLDRIETARLDRLRFVMDFSDAASDTMLEGADAMAGSLLKTGPDFLAKLSRLFRDVPTL